VAFTSAASGSLHVHGSTQTMSIHRRSQIHLEFIRNSSALAMNESRTGLEGDGIKISP
jgi:hypothetical protein